MMERPGNHYEVFWIDRNTGWAAAKFNRERDQIGDAEFAFHRDDLINILSDVEVPVEVYSKNGNLAKVIT